MATELGRTVYVEIAGKDVTRFVRSVAVGSPISATYRPDGTVETITADYVLLDPEAREDMLAWLRAHELDPGRVRTPAEIGYDPSNDEWIFEVFVKGPGGKGIRIDLKTGDPMLRRVRRRVRQTFPITTGLRLAGGGQR